MYKPAHTKKIYSTESELKFQINIISKAYQDCIDNMAVKNSHS